MDNTEDNMNVDKLKNDNIPLEKDKPRKRSLVERELETTLTSHVTSPLNVGEGTSTSRYGRARRLKTSNDVCDPEKTIPNLPNAPQNAESPNINSLSTSPAYKMQVLNSMTHESSNKVLERSLENQIENIYNTNISLSRFGSEEKNKQTQSPVEKFSKVYMRKDLIQSKEKDNPITMIKSIFSPAQSAKKSNNHLNNILERSSDKYNLSKPQNGYMDTSSVVKTLDFDCNKKKPKETTVSKETKNNKETKSTLSKSDLFEMEAKCAYQVGDVAWGRMGTFPFWPCIVTREPGSDMFVRKKLFGKIERDMIHVTFFGDNGRRSWIVDTMLRKYQGYDEFEAARDQFTPEAKKKDPRLYAAFLISDKKLALWHTAIEEADYTQREPKRLRIDLLNELLGYTIKSTTPSKNQKSSKITRTDSDVSLSETLFDSLFSEADGKSVESRPKMKSLDVSEVVTACLDNMAAKTGLTMIQKQSHMDIWLQKAKSKTPEKSQVNVSITVERLDSDSGKSRSKERDNNNSSKKKKKNAPREGPVQKPYSFRKCTESQHLLSYQNEHDYSKNEMIGNSHEVDDTGSQQNAINEHIVQFDSSICVIDKVESLCNLGHVTQEQEQVTSMEIHEETVNAAELPNEIVIADSTANFLENINKEIDKPTEKSQKDKPKSKNNRIPRRSVQKNEQVTNTKGQENTVIPTEIQNEISCADSIANEIDNTNTESEIKSMNKPEKDKLKSKNNRKAIKSVQINEQVTNTEGQEETLIASQIQNKIVCESTAHFLESFNKESEIPVEKTKKVKLTSENFRKTRKSIPINQVVNKVHEKSTKSTKHSKSTDAFTNEHETNSPKNGDKVKCKDKGTVTPVTLLNNDTDMSIDEDVTGLDQNEISKGNVQQPDQLQETQQCKDNIDKNIVTSLESNEKKTEMKIKTRASKRNNLQIIQSDQFQETQHNKNNIDMNMSVDNDVMSVKSSEKKSEAKIKTKASKRNISQILQSEQSEETQLNEDNIDINMPVDDDIMSVESNEKTSEAKIKTKASKRNISQILQSEQSEETQQNKDNIDMNMSVDDDLQSVKSNERKSEPKIKTKASKRNISKIIQSEQSEETQQYKDNIDINMPVDDDIMSVESNEKKSEAKIKTKASKRNISKIIQSEQSEETQQYKDNIDINMPVDYDIMSVESNEKKSEAKIKTKASKRNISQIIQSEQSGETQHNKDNIDIHMPVDDDIMSVESSEKKSEAKIKTKTSKRNISQIIQSEQSEETQHNKDNIDIHMPVDDDVMSVESNEKKSKVKIKTTVSKKNNDLQKGPVIEFVLNSSINEKLLDDVVVGDASTKNQNDTNNIVALVSKNDEITFTNKDNNVEDTSSECPRVQVPEEHNLKVVPKITLSVIKEANIKSFKITSPVKKLKTDHSKRRILRKPKNKKEVFLPMKEPEFLQYLEMKQDAIMDEHPEQTQDEIVTYLYKTWQFETNASQRCSGVPKSKSPSEFTREAIDSNIKSDATLPESKEPDNKLTDEKEDKTKETEKPQGVKTTLYQTKITPKRTLRLRQSQSPSVPEKTSGEKVHNELQISNFETSKIVCKSNIIEHKRALDEYVATNNIDSNVPVAVTSKPGASTSKNVPSSEDKIERVEEEKPKDVYIVTPKKRSLCLLISKTNIEPKVVLERKDIHNLKDLCRINGEISQGETSKAIDDKLPIRGDIKIKAVTPEACQSELDKKRSSRRLRKSKSSLEAKSFSEDGQNDKIPYLDETARNPKVVFTQICNETAPVKIPVVEICHVMKDVEIGASCSISNKRLEQNEIKSKTDNELQDSQPARESKNLLKTVRKPKTSISVSENKLENQITTADKLDSGLLEGNIQENDMSTEYIILSIDDCLSKTGKKNLLLSETNSVQQQELKKCDSKVASNRKTIPELISSMKKNRKSKAPIVTTSSGRVQDTKTPTTDTLKSKVGDTKSNYYEIVINGVISPNAELGESLSKKHSDIELEQNHSGNKNKEIVIDGKTEDKTPSEHELYYKPAEHTKAPEIISSKIIPPVIKDVSSEIDTELEISLFKRRKIKNKKDEFSPMEEPDFLQYLEIKQDAIMDEHPERSHDEIIAYLYKTWQFGTNAALKRCSGIPKSKSPTVFLKEALNINRKLGDILTETKEPDAKLTDEKEDKSKETEKPQVKPPKRGLSLRRSRSLSKFVTESKESINNAAAVSSDVIEAKDINGEMSSEEIILNESVIPTKTIAPTIEYASSETDSELELPLSKRRSLHLSRFESSSKIVIENKESINDVDGDLKAKDVNGKASSEEAIASEPVISTSKNQLSNITNDAVERKDTNDQVDTISFASADNISLYSDFTNVFDDHSSDKDFDPDTVSISSSEISDISVVPRPAKTSVQDRSHVIQKLLDSDNDSFSSMDNISLRFLKTKSRENEMTRNLRHSVENSMDSTKSDSSEKRLRLVLTDCILDAKSNKLPVIKEVISKADKEFEISQSESEISTSKSQSSIEPVVNGFHDSKSPTPESNIDTESIKIIERIPDLDTISIQSSSSETSTKRRGKHRSEHKAMEEPEFLQYLEMRQDALMDEHPEVTPDEVNSYLYKTWQYEESLKSDIKKNDEIESSNLVKGVTPVTQEPPKKKKVSKHKKLINIEKLLAKTSEIDQQLIKKEEIRERELPKRKASKPFYKEDYSDIEEEIEMFEIFKSKKIPIILKTESIKEEVTLESEKVVNGTVMVKNEENVLDRKDTAITDLGEVEKEAKVNDAATIDLDEEDEYYNPEDLYFEELESFLTSPKPNVFKGLIREKVCEICEKPVNLVKCKGCSGMFHIDCVNKEDEVVEIPVKTRGRKKKNKPRGRKPKSSIDSNDDSQSDDKSQDLNMSEENMSVEEIIASDSIVIPNADNFESQLEAKMKEIIDVEQLDYDSYSSDDGIDWSATVAGKCEIVDVKLKPRQQPANTENFKCKNCQKEDTPICFVCKSPVSPKHGTQRRQKCQVAHCHKYYHLDCLEHWPQTQFNAGEPSRSNKKIDEHFEALSCPRHVCHTCVSDDPRGCKTRFSGDKLARCVRCPATYHSFTKCLPAGTQILSASHIVCPRHYEHRPGKIPYHVNTGWCFICALGGKLICCDYCPTSFHADCLNIQPPEGGYMCEDCETGRLPLYGEMVWVKLGHYRWWPGIVLHPSEIPDNILAVKHSPGEFVVRFFGQYDHYWVNRGRVFPFQEGDSGKISAQKSKIDEAFTIAMEHAQRAFEILKNIEPNDIENQDIQSSLLPPHYVKLKVNKPCGALYGKKVDIEESSLTQCECNPDEEEPCGPYSHCLNRMLLTECGPICRAGEMCQNRAFEKRQYPKLVPYRTPHRGWGLKTLEPIKAGQFVIEYVGELIDEAEFRRRMQRKHDIRDENFYFLTLDKERMIDAGPKGNLARFMNHCCEPNCETQKWTVLGDIRVGLFAIYDIPANTEVTFNYNLECSGIDKKRCMCGAPRCAGYIGAKLKQEEPQPKKLKAAKRTYKKRKHTIESPSASHKPKRPVGRPAKPRETETQEKELTEIEKDLLIIKNATNGISSDSEGSRLSSIDVDKKDAKAFKRKRASFSLEERISVKRIKLDEDEKITEIGD